MDVALKRRPSEDRSYDARLADRGPQTMRHTVHFGPEALLPLERGYTLVEAISFLRARGHGAVAAELVAGTPVHALIARLRDDVDAEGAVAILARVWDEHPALTERQIEATAAAYAMFLYERDAACEARNNDLGVVLGPRPGPARS